MVEKLDQFEVLKEVSLTIDSLPPDERRQIMAALAERFGMKLVDKTSSGRSGFKPYPKRKRSY